MDQWGCPYGLAIALTWPEYRVLLSHQSRGYKRADQMPTGSSYLWDSEVGGLCVPPGLRAGRRQPDATTTHSMGLSRETTTRFFCRFVTTSRPLRHAACCLMTDGCMWLKREVVKPQLQALRLPSSLYPSDRWMAERP